MTLPEAPLRVLVVDPHLMVIELLARLFETDAGFAVVGAATTGKEAVLVARAQQPDVVVMSLCLSDMDGVTAARALLDEQPGLRVVMRPGAETIEVAPVGTDLGAVTWLPRTHSLGELRDAVRVVGSGEPLRLRGTAGLPPLSQLVVHYQPVVELATRRVVSMEALVRWRHPRRGLLLPLDFLPLAEETGYVIQIGRRVLDEATRQLSAWQRHHPQQPRLSISINLSASAVVSPDIVEAISAAVEASGIEAADLVLEITETTLLDETSQTLGNLHALRDLGVRLALDDFGTAFSSIAYLRRFPFDVLKIDPTFTAELPSSPRARLLVQSISHIADGLGLIAIAEGIERPTQVHCLREAGWRFGQGYLYSRPAEARAVERLLRRRRERCGAT